MRRLSVCVAEVFWCDDGCALAVRFFDTGVFCSADVQCVDVAHQSGPNLSVSAVCFLLPLAGPMASLLVMTLAGSSPGSDAFYRRSMRKGTGGDAEGEAMRANLAFQNALRETSAHGAGAVLDASKTLSSKRSRRARERAAHAHVSTPTEAEVDALLARLADGSPSLLKAGITPPKPAWVPPKPPAADAAAFPAWLPVEAMPPARENAAASAKTPPKHARVIHFATPGETAAAARAHDGPDAPEDAPMNRLPIFERLYRQVPSGQRSKFGFPDATATERTARDTAGTPTKSPRLPKDLREKRREIALLKAELAAREMAEAAGAADAAALIAAEMARRGGLIPDACEAKGPTSPKTTTESATDRTASGTFHEENVESRKADAQLALAEAAAREALEKILESPKPVASRRSPFGSPTEDPPNFSPLRRPGVTHPTVSRLASDPAGVDWRFAEGAFEFGSAGKAPWRERALRAESNRNAKAAAWEGEVRARALAKAHTEQLVVDAERELERLRRRRAEIVTRQMHARALTNAKADPKRAPRARAPWGFESTAGTIENIRNAATASPSSPMGMGSPLEDGDDEMMKHASESAAQTPPAAERSPLMAERSPRSYGAAERPAPARRNPSARGPFGSGSGAVSGAEAARLAAARVRAREREEAKAAAAAKAAAKTKAEAEMFRARRAAEREKKSFFAAKAPSSSSFLAPTAASVGKVAHKLPGPPRPATAAARATRRSEDFRGHLKDSGTTRTPSKAFVGEKKEVGETAARVDKLERDVGFLRTEVASRGDAVRLELEGLRAQMTAMLEMLSSSGKMSAERRSETQGNTNASFASANGSGVSVSGSPVKSTLPPTPPRGAPPPRVDAKSAPASPARAPAPRGGPSPAASPRAAAIPAERGAEIPEKSATPFLSG